MRDHAHSTANVNTYKYGKSAKIIPLPGVENARKSEYTTAIELWVQDLRECAALEREEIAQLEGVNRILVLAKGLLPNLVALCRKNKRADTRAAILVIIHFCADNSDGLCRLSVARFAKLLSRKEDTIRDALADLEEMGSIVIERTPRGNCYWPRIAAEIVDLNPSLGWFIDALSEKPKPVGCPKNAPRQRSVYYYSNTNTPPLRGVIPPPYAGTYRTKLKDSDLERTNIGEPIRGTYARTHTHAPAYTRESSLNRGGCGKSEHNFEGMN